VRTKFRPEKLKDVDQSSDLGVEGKKILGWMSGKIVREVVDWMHLVQDRDRWRALVNTVINFRVPNRAENYVD
jgi:hypothetical protein